MSAEPQASDAASAMRNRAAVRRALLVPAAVAAGTIAVLTGIAFLADPLENELMFLVAWLWPLLVAPCALALGLTGLGAVVGRWLPRTAAVLAGLAWGVLVSELLLVLVYVLIGWASA